jgi:hypothetical protein
MLLLTNAFYTVVTALLLFAPLQANQTQAQAYCVPTVHWLRVQIYHPESSLLSPTIWQLATALLQCAVLQGECYCFAH